MVNLTLYKNNIKYENGQLIDIVAFNLYCKLNIVSGDSGVGKSLIFDKLREAQRETNGWKFKCTVPLRLIFDMPGFDDALKYSGSLLVLDEDMTSLIYRNNLSEKLIKSNNYFLLFDRGTVIKLETNINAVFRLRLEQVISRTKIFNVEQIFGLNGLDTNSINIDNIRYIVTEDTASGKIFWAKLFKNLQLVESNANGNGGIVYSILKLANTDGLILVALDYDAGIMGLQRIINRKSEIDLKRLKFIPLESFEEVICNSEFILSKFPEMRDEVINYKNYIDCTYKHTGKYFSRLLHKYVKVKSPIIKDSRHNITKFYSKGMKNFEQCFINDCCEFNSKDCKLYFNGDKRKAMLSNKFEFLQELL